MDVKHISTDKLLKYTTENPSLFYTLLSDYRISEDGQHDFTKKFISKVYQLFESNIIRKDLVYLSLLAGQNYSILEKFKNYDKAVFTLDINDPASLYDYYVYERRHWIHHILNNLETYRKDLPNNIYQKLLLLRLVQATHSIIDVNSLMSVLGQINLDYLDGFWSFYVNSVSRSVDILKFLKSVNNSDDKTLFTFINENSILDITDSYVDLKNYQNWENILLKIQQYGDAQQVNTFTAFIIMGTLANLVINNTYNSNLKNDFINGLTHNIKNKLLNLEDQHLQLELLENTFSLIFHRNSDEFTCKEKEIRLILFLLKTVVDELQQKRTHLPNSEEFARLSQLHIYVTDALWRLEVIVSLKNSPKLDDSLLNYMLAAPESLLHMCLKRENYEKAFQVIKIFNLEESPIAQEVLYADHFLKFKKELKRTAKNRAPISKSVQDFVKLNPAPLDAKDEKLEKFALKFRYVSQFLSFNNESMNIFDIAITHAKSEDCQTLLKLAQEKCTDDNIPSDYKDFRKRITEISDKVEGKSASEILTDPFYPLDVEEYSKNHDFLTTLSKLYDDFYDTSKYPEGGSLNKNHPSHKIIQKINDLCTQMNDSSEQYLLKVLNYLQSFSKVLYIEQNTSEIISRGYDASFFQILNFNRSELMGKLLFERNLDPTEFEKYFAKLKLDFLYHVVGNCFPTINLHIQENVTLEELYHDNMLFVPSQSIIIYIQKRNWLLAFILNEMYKVEGVKIDISKARLQTFFNYLQLPKIQQLKILFDNNEIVAALQNCINSQKVRMYFEEQIMNRDLGTIPFSPINNQDHLETGEEISEDAKTTNWKQLYDIIKSVPESQMRKKADLDQWRNNILVNIVQEGFEPEYYNYTRFITDSNLRIATILENFKKWPGTFVLDIIKSEITRFDAVADSRLKMLHKWMLKIQFHDKLKAYLDLGSWYQSYDYCETYPQDAMRNILQTNDCNLLLDFIDLHDPKELIRLDVDSEYITKIMELNTPLEKIKALLDRLVFSHTINICNNLLTVLRNLDHLQFIVDYLKNNVEKDYFLRSVQVSLKMLTAFTTIEQEELFCLIHEPLDILEVLMMNTKLDKLAAVLDLLDLANPHTDYDNSVISVEQVDGLLRKYAEKSLDFRVVTRPNPKLFRMREHKLLQSLDSLTPISERKVFIIPENVPTKEKWVQNEEVLECMCCRLVTFSMFNRRHHCRRCGRVVCYNCSQKRMLVPTYGDIMVRVCFECYKQVMGNSGSSERSDVPSSRSLSQENWILNDDPEHNKIVRDEFSYEHAPSISLCLSILKYHSKSGECPKFLLTQCEEMLRLLQPNQEPTQEIDFLLVIKMLKSLAVAAKMLSMEHMMSSGASLAERVLAQAELLALLAERRCLNLMPILETKTSYVDASVLRRLRDKLLQREQWELALEVSTKAGLDNAGVFAAWGKSCLKGGSLQLAREKLQRCLERHTQHETLSNTLRWSDIYKSTDSLNVSGISRGRLSSRISTSSDTKPTKDPPLLQEIIQILETKTRTISPEVLKSATVIKMSESYSSLTQLPSISIQTQNALSIRNKIKGLKNIAAGNYSLRSETTKRPYITKPQIDPVFYDECVYYLSRYGTYASLMDFYLRHGNLDKALTYIIEYRLSSDIFVELYIKCVKDGIVNILQDNMSKIDSSLELWKDYLKVLCRQLEQQGLLHCLYQLQLYIGDYVRAAMTSIRFYQDNAKSFIELTQNVQYLYNAEEHMRQVLELEQWVEVTSVGSTSDESKEGFEEKTLANPSLVMKIHTKDVNQHIKTAQRQLELVNFLAECESSNIKTMDLLKDLYFRSDQKPEARRMPIPTLFGSQFDRKALAVMPIIAGENVEDGFGITLRILKEFKLKPITVYGMAGKYFGQNKQYKGITQLVNCIKASEMNDDAVSDLLDEMLSQAVTSLAKANMDGTKVEDLIKLIKDRGTKISAYIEAKQLKTAYFLAVKYKRTPDIRRIQREAELLNIPSIKALCQRVLQTASHSKET